MDDMTGRGRLRTGIGLHGAELRRLATRSREVLLLAAIVGAATGLGVALFDTVVTKSVEWVDRLPLWAAAILPLFGLSVAAASLRWIGPSPSPATADEYLHAFHDPDHTLQLRPLVARMIAGIGTERARKRGAARKLPVTRVDRGSVGRARTAATGAAFAAGCGVDRLYERVLHLPWVVEPPYGLDGTRLLGLRVNPKGMR